MGHTLHECLSLSLFDLRCDLFFLLRVDPFPLYDTHRRRLRRRRQKQQQQQQPSDKAKCANQNSQAKNPLTHTRTHTHLNYHAVTILTDGGPQTQRDN